MIPNHYTAKLSELDLQMVRAVPPGGNWKNIPVSVPSDRLEQIRKSYAAGEGSRSTYYGRLAAGDPAYTITTYFNRPGNGCFMHYDFEGEQHRLISQREAARLQSFPDSFEFFGSKGKIFKQIGNAVPPLLAYQIAKKIGVGSYVDLFSGAGGLSLGFHWAGWLGLLANDIEADFLSTYSQYFGIQTVCGDIAQSAIREEIIDRAHDAKVSQGGPFYVLGGPPCQGFSTAGRARSMDDQRNHLFRYYADVLHALKPDGFIFENVPGLLNMRAGAVLEEIKSVLSAAGFTLEVWKLNAQDYAVPQRRTRLVLVGTRKNSNHIAVPMPVSNFERNRTRAPLFALKRTPGVRDAIGDLPKLESGQDGSSLSYLDRASSSYQSFMRGEITPAEYLDEFI